MIDGYSRRLKKGRITLEEVGDLGLKINSTVKRMNKIISGVLKQSRIQESQTSSFSIKELIGECQVLTENKALSGGVTVMLGEVQDLHCHGYELRISQILVNLVNNAIDAVEDHPAESWVSVSAIKDGDWIQISVQDSGTGTSEDLQKKYLIPFLLLRILIKGPGLD